MVPSGQGDDGLLEYGPFCSYIETHLSLARVLEKLGRPYEAEYRLSRCMLAIYVMSAGQPEVARYHIAEANTWALVWKLLKEERPSEADEARDYAILVWREVLAKFPEAANYHSGVHAPQSDLAWFRSLLNEEEAARLDSDDPLPVHEVMRSFPSIAFASHATGRSWYDAGNYKAAIRSLEASARLRDEDHAYPWLHLAMAHAQLGDQAKADEWLQKAIEAISELPNPPAELIELRDEAQRIVLPASANADSTTKPHAAVNSSDGPPATKNATDPSKSEEN